MHNVTSLIKMINDLNAWKKMKPIMLTIAAYSITKVIVAFLYTPLLNMIETTQLTRINEIIILVVVLTIINIYLLNRIQKNKEKMALEIERECVNKIIANVSCVDYQEINNQGVGNWLNILSEDAKKISYLIAINLMDIVLVLFNFVIASIFGIYISPTLTITIIIIAFFSVMLPKYFSEKLINHKADEQDSRDGLNETIISILKSKDFMKAIHKIRYAVELFNQSYHKYNKKALSYQRYHFTIQALSTGMSFLMTALWISAAFILIKYDKLSIGNFLGFMVLDNFFISIFSVLPNHLTQLIGNYASYERIKTKLINHETLISETSKTFETLVFSDITIDLGGTLYSYNDLTIALSKGKKINIKGKSGSGKTTLLHLLTGLYYSGDMKVRLNEQIELSLDEIADYLTYMPQKTVVFSGTIKENILLGRAISIKEMNDIIDQSGLSELIKDLPHGIDTNIEHGMLQNLSQGQIQRIGFARALVKQAPIFILDEPTSSLDDNNSKIIMKYLEDTTQSVILVTHKQRDVPEVFETIELANIFARDKNTQNLLSE